MTGNQRPDSIFLQVWTLYQTCRRNGVWAKIVVETSGGEEEYTFSSRKQLYSETKRKPPSSPKPFTPSNKRKSPSKWRKDNVKWRAWLEKKLQETSGPSGPCGPPCEETPSEAQKETSVPIEPPCEEIPSEALDPASLLQTSPPPTQGRNNIIRTPGGTLLAVLEPLAVGGGEDGVEDHPLPPGERPGDDMDTDTDNGLDPSNPGVPPGVPPDGLEDPVYGLCTKQDCVSCEMNEFTAPLPNNRLCTDHVCPTIHWHRKTSDCKYVKTKNFTYNFSR